MRKRRREERERGREKEKERSEGERECVCERFNVKRIIIISFSSISTIAIMV